MIQQETQTKKYVRIRFRGETLIRLSTITWQTLQPDFNFGSGSRSSQSSPCRVTRETQATESCVGLLWKSSVIEARVTPR